MKNIIVLIAILILAGCDIAGTDHNERVIISDTLVVSAVGIGQDKFDRDSDTLHVNIYNTFGFDPDKYRDIRVNVVGKENYKVLDFRSRSFVVLKKGNIPYEIVKDDSIYFYCEANKRK